MPNQEGSVLTRIDTSPPVELHDTGLSPLDVIQKHSHFGADKSLSNPSYSSFSGGAADFNSTISHSSAALNSQAPPSDRVDSPQPLPSPEPYDRVTSGVSAVTEADRTHLRNISEASAVSSTGFHPVERPQPERAISESTEPVTTPVSPPTAMEAPGDDYLSAPGVVSPIRKSLFRENEEDLGKHQ